MLLFIGYWGLLGLIIMAILFFMVIIGLPYFVIKRARLYFSLLREMKKKMPLSFQERGKMSQNSALNTGFGSFSFIESLDFGRKKYKMLLFISILFGILQSLPPFLSMIGESSDAKAFITFLPNFIAGCLMFFTLILGVLCLRSHGKLREVNQQLEEAIKQRDKALYIKGTIGVNDDQ